MRRERKNVEAGPVWTRQDTTKIHTSISKVGAHLLNVTLLWESNDLQRSLPTQAILCLCDTVLDS